MFALDHLYEAVRIGHVVFASVGLASLAIPLIAKKGAKVHRRVGWVFVIAMIVAAFTGIAIALAWIVAPLQVKPPPADWTSERIEARVAGLRSFGVFLAFIGVILLNSIASGIGALSRKHAPLARPRFYSLLLPAILLSGGIGLVIWGLANGVVLHVFFGAIGIFAGTTDGRFVLRPLPSKMAWWYQHMNGMLTAVIAALSAFLVFNANRLLGDSLPASLAFLPWVLPTIVGVPASILWVRYYTRKFREARA